MFSDEKHIREVKIPRFASNIITALKEAYNIKDKRDLFEVGKRRNLYRNRYEDHHKLNTDRYEQQDTRFDNMVISYVI